MPTEKSDDDLPIWGAEGIAKTLKIPVRKAFYMLGKKLLPATRLGNSFVTTRRRLLARINGEDGFVPPRPKAKAAPPTHVPKSLKRKLKPSREQRAGA